MTLLINSDSLHFLVILYTITCQMSVVEDHILTEWESTLSSEIKQCGEALQRHTCRAVCHKYGNTDKCRFLFPHDVVDKSYFDADSNSIVLNCKDPTVNYFNPNILVFCCHNHDLKCILSGKSAKAAMFYISDYITKMDTKTYEMLSLLSCAVSRLPLSPATQSPVDDAKTLLHKCLSQFTRQQQIHAQQAARYVCRFGDGIPSHQTVAMLSSLLISYVKDTMQSREPLTTSTAQKECVPEENDEAEDPVLGDEHEDVRIRVATDKNGAIVECNQIHHYIYRESTLADMCFYDFSHCVHFQSKVKSKDTKNTPKTRLGVLQRHALLADHLLSQTHELLEHTNEEHGEGTHEYVPCVVGMAIPWSTDPTQWALFALSHFKPFSSTDPLIPPQSSIDEVFKSFDFSPRHLAIMEHWEAVHECKDERDADRLCKQAQLITVKKTRSSPLPELDDDVDVSRTTLLFKTAQEEFKINQFVLLLKQC
jgi:hypothetical protein